MGTPIEDSLADEDKTCFSRATTQLLRDDSQSVRCRFWLALPRDLSTQHSSLSELSKGHTVEESLMEALEIDANGILIHDRMVGGPTHVR